MVTQINSTLIDLLMPHTMREIEREAERRRLMGELVHSPGRLRNDLRQIGQRVRATFVERDDQP
jgi:hypothetical protein